jgi:hypothetical protein
MELQYVTAEVDNFVFALYSFNVRQDDNGYMDAGCDDGNLLRGLRVADDTQCTPMRTD